MVRRRLRRRVALTAMTWPRTRAVRVTAAVGLLMTVVVAGWIAILGPSLRWVLVSAIVLGLVLALAVRRRQSDRLDIVDPIVVFSLAWLAMFALRPVASALVDDWTLRQRYDVDQWIDAALVLALVAEASYCVAYLIAARGGTRVLLRGPKPFMSSGSGYFVAISFACVGLLATILSFGSQIESSSAYVQSLPTLSIPAALLLIGLSAGRPTLQRFLAYSIVIVVLLSFALIGVRTWILPLLGSVTFLWYFQRGARPQLRTIVLAGAIGLIAFSNLELTRSFSGGNAGISFQELEPVAALKRLSTGPSSEMLPALALQVGTEGEDWTFSPGYWPASLITHWIPSDVWQEKPRSSSELLYSIFFPDDYAVSRANTQFSVIGEFYFDSSVFGVVAGLAGVGWLTALAYAWFRRHEANHWAQISYSMFPWIMIFGLRGDLLQTSTLAFYLYLPVAFAYLISPRARQVSDEVPTLEAPPKPQRPLRATRP
jgi:oligosaccharide repeat unit polymerase